MGLRELTDAVHTFVRDEIRGAYDVLVVFVHADVPSLDHQELARFWRVVQFMHDHDPRPGWPRKVPSELIAGVWAAALGVEAVGLDEHFFDDLGGHSFLATQVAFRLRTMTGLDVPVSALFDCPTVSELAGLIREQAAG